MDSHLRLSVTSPYIDVSPFAHDYHNSEVIPGPCGYPGFRVHSFRYSFCLWVMAGHRKQCKRSFTPKEPTHDPRSGLDRQIDRGRNPDLRWGRCSSYDVTGLIGSQKLNATAPWSKSEGLEDALLLSAGWGALSKKCLLRDWGIAQSCTIHPACKRP